LPVANQVCAIWVDDESELNPTTFGSIPKRQFNVYPKSKSNKLENLNANSSIRIPMTYPILFPNTLIHSGLLFQQLVLDIELQAMAKDL
jgi:hypothetical protein